MIAGKIDLSKIFPCRLHIPEIFLCDRRKSYNGIHWRADVMGHGREEIGLCLICRLRFSGCDLKTPVKVKYIEQIAEEQDQQTGRNDPDQQPVFSIHIEILRRHEAQHRPSFRCRNRSKSEYALLFVRVDHWNRACR